MKNWLIAFLLICQTGVYADSWLPASVLIPEGSSVGVNYDVITVYDPAHEVTVAAWADRAPSAPFYAIYDGSSWTTPGTPIPLGTSSGVYFDVTLVFNTANQTVVAAWKDNSDSLPFYAVFDGSSWITPGSPIPVGSSTGVKTNVNLTYNQANQTVFAAWADPTSDQAYYSVFNGSSWTTATLLPLGITSSGVRNDVGLTYDVANQTVIAAWSDETTRFPFYSVFNGTIWTTTGSLIPLGTSSGAGDNVFLVYYPTNQTVIAAWGDLVTSLPFNAVYNGSSWTTANAIPPEASGGVAGNVNMAFNIDSQTIFATWSDSTLFTPYFSIFNGTSWSTGLIPLAPSDGINFDVPLSYNENAHQMVATWSNSGNQLPYYQIYTTTIAPPANLVGRSFYNKFASQKVWVNRLKWTASSSSFVVGYNIYRNGVLIAQVDADTFHYNDQGRCKGKRYVYGVASVIEGGLESALITITLR